jgi:Sulfotransferase domain
MILPKFIGIGAPRCGTRWLARCLSEHQHVAIPPDEVYFFTTRRMVHSFWSKGLEWYSGLFEKCVGPGVTTWGEVTPIYLFDDDTPSLMHQCVPDAKLICCLRDQAERAHSWYRLFLKVNPDLFRTDYSFKSFLTYHTEVYGREGFYLEHLQRYLEYYPRDSILIMLYDDLEKDPLSYIRQIYEYLGVDSSYIPESLTKKINPMILELPKSKSLRTLSAYLGKFRGLQKYGELLNKVINVRVARSEFPRRHRLNPEIRNRIAELYSDHNERLGSFLGRDLSHWNRPVSPD